MIDQYDLYAWLRAKGRTEKEIKSVEDVIDLYISETFGPDKTYWKESS